MTPETIARKTKEEVLPRGVRRRGRSLVIYLTHPNGDIERRSLGKVTPKFAEQQRMIFEREIAEGRYLKPVPRTDQVLFSTICDQAIEHYKNYARCWDAVSQRSKVLKEWWGSRPADSITTQEINDKLLQNTGTRGLSWSPTTSNEYRVTLLRIYSLAIDAGLLTVNPATKAKRYRLENMRTRELSATEEERLRKAIRDKFPSKEVELDLALHVGCRASNLYGIHRGGRKHMDPLSWEAINFDWKVVSFPRSKNGSSYMVPLNQVALDALKVLLKRSPDGTGPVIRKPSGIELHSARKWFEACLKAACITNFRWHDLRHSFATRLRRAGTSIEDIRELLGHGTKSVTERYAHADMTTLAAAVAKLVPKTETGTNTDTPSVVEFPRAEAV